MAEFKRKRKLDIVQEESEEVEKPEEVETVGESDLFVEPPEYTAVSEDAAPSVEREIPEEYKDAEFDTQNTIFKEDLHLRDPITNKPKTNKDGTFRKRKQKKISISVDSTDIESERALTSREARAAAKTYFLLFKKTGSLLMGKDFSNCDVETEKYMIGLFQAVCEKHDSTGLTPEQMLAIGCTEYTLVKAEEKACLDYLIRVKIKIVNFFKSNKKKKEEQKQQ